MTTKPYFRVRLQGVSPTHEDVLSSSVFEYGATGLSEALPFVQPDLTYDPKILNTRAHEIDVFFPEKPTVEFTDYLRTLSPTIQWQIHQEESKDWLEEWKKGFKPFQLVGPYWIVPTWEKAPEQCQSPLWIDPGMAFGTGTHATTQMASYFVHKVATELFKSSKPVLNFLDVGTGTAVLAMLASRAGFADVYGLEIDPEARRVARENIARNQIDNIMVFEEALEDLAPQWQGSFDVVIANIIDGVLINLRKDLLRVVKTGGSLFLTGILLERDDHFYKNFIEDSGFQVHRRLEKDEWVGYWLKKES